MTMLPWKLPALRGEVGRIHRNNLPRANAVGWWNDLRAKHLLTRVVGSGRVTTWFYAPRVKSWAGDWTVGQIAVLANTHRLSFHMRTHTWRDGRL